ncbi:hypothetical protein ACG2LH_12615 [Zhouia sp. PK063]|uniref:hypothetical protein n=1 Tax=Zhouia sp. PK063 TaxID=3373602 RepID=UPI0037A1F547
MWTLFMVFSIYESVMYRKGKYHHTIRFFTNNDAYHKTYSFIIGFVAIIGGFCMLLFLKEDFIFSSLILLNGVLLIVSGVFSIPNGIILIKNKELIVMSGHQKNTIAMDTIQEIHLTNDHIVFIDHAFKNYHNDHLKLQSLDLTKIATFIKSQLDTPVKILIKEA